MIQRHFFRLFFRLSLNFCEPKFRQDNSDNLDNALYQRVNPIFAVPLLRHV
nr:MAG TPA_asm: hypothetical protein [Caudoviricetes sp.]